MFSSDTSKARELLRSGDLVDAISKSENLEKMRYTYLHRRVVLELAYENNIHIPALWFHDCDKLVMFLFHSDEEVSKEHRKTVDHHNQGTTDENILTEMMLDWESARFTKPDKPLNALGTLYKWFPQMEDKMLPVLKKYTLDKETISKPITEEDFAKMASDVTPEMIASDIAHYLNNETVENIVEEINEEINAPKSYVRVKVPYFSTSYIRIPNYSVIENGFFKIWDGNWEMSIDMNEINAITDTKNGKKICLSHNFCVDFAI